MPPMSLKAAGAEAVAGVPVPSAACGAADITAGCVEHAPVRAAAAAMSAIIISARGCSTRTKAAPRPCRRRCALAAGCRARGRPRPGSATLASAEGSPQPRWMLLAAAAVPRAMGAHGAWSGALQGSWCGRDVQAILADRRLRASIRAQGARASACARPVPAWDRPRRPPERGLGIRISYPGALRVPRCRFDPIMENVITHSGLPDAPYPLTSRAGHGCSGQRQPTVCRAASVLALACVGRVPERAAAPLTSSEGGKTAGG